MSQERFKLALVNVARDNPHLIDMLTLEDNFGYTDRIAIHPNEVIYRHSGLGLWIRIVPGVTADNTLAFSIQFEEGPNSPINWNEPIGDFAANKDLKIVVIEKIEIVNDVICFRQYQHVIDYESDENPLRHQQQAYHGVSYNLNTGYLDLYFMDIAKTGRAKKRFRKDCYLDYVVDDKEYQYLYQTLTDWGKRNKFNDDEMKQIMVFCMYCRDVKSTKQKSKMVRIIDYLKDNPLPHRS